LRNLSGNSENSRIIPLLRERLNRGVLPGTAAHRFFMPDFERVPAYFGHTKDPVNCGVLMLLTGEEPDLNLTFIIRTEDKGPHSGQIAFPGGRREESDRDMTETAIREAQEEAGVHPESLTLVGLLTPLYIPVSNMRVYPVIAYSQQEPDYTPQPEEVLEVFSLPLAFLANPANVQWYDYKSPERTFRYPGIPVKGRVLWGATAMIVSELIEIMKESALLRS
jgi:8-oxo-dGTP pyrophosphatase MutT (NUDIX family)